MCLSVLLNNKEPVSKGQDRQPLKQGANPPGVELSTKVPASHTSDTPEKQAEVKKNKRERKEERQKNRKKEKKELKLEGHQENSRGQKPKKRKTGQEQEADQEAGGEAPGSAGKKSQSKGGKAKGAVDGARDAKEEPTQPPPGKRKKHADGTWLAFALGSGTKVGREAVNLRQTSRLEQARQRA